MEEFKNLDEIIELCVKELYIGDRNIHATLGFEELKELQCLLDNYNVHKRSNAILLAQKRELEKEVRALDSVVIEHMRKNKEQEKVIELMGEYLSTYAMYSDEESCFCIVKGKDCNKKEDVTCKECVIEFFRKKAKGE